MATSEPLMRLETFFAQMKEELSVNFCAELAEACGVSPHQPSDDQPLSQEKSQLVATCETHSYKLVTLLLNIETALNDALRQFQDSEKKYKKLAREQANALVYSAEIIEVLQETYDELDQARKESEAATRAKSDFLDNMSHELRTPLHGILSFARFGIDESLTAQREELLDYFQRINTSGETLLNLVNNLLDLGKLEAGKISFDFQPVDLASLVSGVADEFISLCSERNLQVVLDLPDFETQAVADEEKFKQVVRNLVSNALKFSPPEGVIRIAIHLENQGLCVSVCDEGPGLPEAELETVFDKYVQSSQTKNGAGGTGLGLAICREIVAGHQGRIWAENLPIGGAKFCVQLPKTPLEAAHAEASPANC